MAWYQFWKNSKADSNQINEDVFTEKSEKKPNSKEMGIHQLYAMLNTDNEQKGFDDALINPDISHLDEGITIIKNDLQRSIDQVKLYYGDYLQEIDFHIESRKSSSMFTVVEELTMRKDIAKNHLEKVLKIESESQNGRADQLAIVRTYVRGFKRGLAAITFTEMRNYNH